MYLITWITTHLPTPEGWMAELAKARSMQPYIILYKTTLQLGVRLVVRGQGQGLVNWSLRILEDKDFPRGQEHGK